MELYTAAGQETYLRRYRETWIASYGSDRGFTPVHLEGAKYRQQQDRNSVLEAWCEDTPCGILELALHQGEEQGVGHIALLHLEELCGSVERGKSADLTVFRESPLENDPAALSAVLTMVCGEIVYQEE